MSDIANLAPDLAKLIGVQPSTLVLLLVILVKLANMAARGIPDDATGWLGTVRTICAIVGAHVPSKVTSGVTVNDVARAALETPPIPAKVAADTKGA